MQSQCVGERAVERVDGEEWKSAYPIGKPPNKNLLVLSCPAFLPTLGGSASDPSEIKHQSRKLAPPSLHPPKVLGGGAVRPPAPLRGRGAGSFLLSWPGTQTAKAHRSCQALWPPDTLIPLPATVWNAVSRTGLLSPGCVRPHVSVHFQRNINSRGESQRREAACQVKGTRWKQACRV